MKIVRPVGVGLAWPPRRMGPNWQPRSQTASVARATARLRYCFFSSRRRHTRLQGDWSSDVCSSDLGDAALDELAVGRLDAAEQSVYAAQQRPRVDVARR